MRLVNPDSVSRRTLVLAGSLALFAWAVSLGGSVEAYVPPVDDLWARLGAGAPLIRSAIVDTETQVYDLGTPAASAAPGGAPPLTGSDSLTSAETPKPLVGREFRQRIYWQRGSWLAVETTATDGTLLHLLLRDGYRTYSQSLSPRRVLSEADLRPVLFPFLEASPAAWREELTFWGVQPIGVNLVLYKASTAYLLGEGSGQALWVDHNGDRPVRLEAKISGAVPLRISVQFSDFMAVMPKDADAANPRLPKTLTYEVGGRMFRRTIITELQPDAPVRSFPIARWRQQLGQTVQAPAYTLLPNDGGKP